LLLRYLVELTEMILQMLDVVSGYRSNSKPLLLKSSSLLTFVIVIARQSG